MTNNNNKITTEKITETITQAQKDGYSVYIIINGEYYELTQENNK